MADIYVFYANLLIGQFSYDNYRIFAKDPGAEIYNGAFVYFSPHKEPWKKWYRMDGTPVLDSDVPPELKLTVLLLGP